MTHTKTSVSALLNSYGLHPSRALGQNFVVDPNTVRRIARLASVNESDHVLEIGAGLGSLTVALAETGARVTAMELDRHLIAPLRATVETLGVTIVEGDALTIDYDALLHDEPCVVVANLPYNVATTIVLHLLESVPLVSRMLVMVQLEVGERLAAAVGDDAFGAVSLRLQYFADAHLVGRVSPNVFLPKPKVESVLVSIGRRTNVAIDPNRVSEAQLFDVIRTAFQHRRKMLRRSLAPWATEQVFTASGVAATMRPEELSLEDFARIAEVRS